jgi:hypothetical protein
VSSREYWVGLPVGVCVDDDGTVTFTIDFSEAGDGILEEVGNEFGSAPEVTEDQALLDYATVNAYPVGPPQATLAPSLMGEMECPVRYSCGFRTAGRAEMAAHIASDDHA